MSELHSFLLLNNIPFCGYPTFYSPIHQVIDLWVVFSFEMQYKSPIYEPSSCELSKILMCLPSMPGVSEIATCLPSSFNDNPSALPSPTSSPFCSQQLFLPFTQCQPIYANCTELLYFSSHCAVRLKTLNFLCMLYTTCVKHITNWWQHSGV